LVPAESERLVLLPEPGLVDHPRLVEVVELVDLGAELPKLRFEDSEEFGLLPERLVCQLQLRSNLIVREQEVPDLLLEDGFEVVDRDLVAAGVAGVFRAVRGHVHLRTAGAVREAREEVHGGPCSALQAASLAVEVLVALCPQLL